MSTPFLQSRPSHRARTRNRPVAFGPSFSRPAVAASGDAPHLLMPPPQSGREAWVSGGITTAAHAVVILILFLLGLQAKDIVEELIPVQIIRELPGSNEVPAPAPRKVIPRRAMVNPATVRPRAMPQAVKPVPAAVQTPQAIEMAKLDTSAAPTRLDRRQVESRVVDARAVTQAPRVAAVDLSQVQAIDVNPSDLNAPQVEYTGPTRVADGTAVQVDTTQAFAGLDAADDVVYDGQAPSTGATFEGAPAGDWNAIDVGFEGEFVEGASGVGGTGTAVGVTACLSSAYVQRYLGGLRDRVQARWIIPEGTAANAVARIGFQIDASGSASQIEVRKATSPEFGASVARAMREASPFPPMDDDVRCLAAHKLRAIFENPDL